ncbi:hypothetical protein CEXT_367911 [Caerostris extrusa]|uniref:Uncharacterized protein n=1 Tax=Caerostris extrusa TaxID=172846 RepID=A0AAV4MZX2_CAEEX|nr:hypothetical protein CEXT_367911 [Caerostris extrusa]
MKLPFGQERGSLHFSSSLDTMDASNRVTTRVDRGQRGHRKQGSKDLNTPPSGEKPWRISSVVLQTEVLSSKSSSSGCCDADLIDQIGSFHYRLSRFEWFTRQWESKKNTFVDDKLVVDVLCNWCKVMMHLSVLSAY